jgi:hypothetical protein
MHPVLFPGSWGRCPQTPGVRGEIWGIPLPLSITNSKKAIEFDICDRFFYYYLISAFRH